MVQTLWDFVCLRFNSHLTLRINVPPLSIIVETTPMNHTENKRVALFVATLGSFLITFASSSVNIALPLIGNEFVMDAVTLSWVATGYYLVWATLILPFGRLGDIYGRKKIFSFGIVIYLVSSLLTALSNSAATLISLRMFTGIGGAMIYGTGVAILTSVFPPGERGKAFGINVAATYLGLSGGPFLGGVLTQFFGWRSISLANVPVGFIAILFIVWKLKGEWAEAQGEQFDFIGSIIYSFMIIAIIYGFSILYTIRGVLLFLIGLIGIFSFIRYERNVRDPVLNMNLFKNNIIFAFSNLAALVNFSALHAVSFLISLYLQYVKGFSPQTAGLILVSQPIIIAVVSPFAGRLSDRTDARIVASIGMALTALGLAFFIFLDGGTALWFIIMNLVLLGFGFALFSSPNTNAAMSTIDRQFYGVALATLGTMRATGQMLSMGIATLLFAIYIGKTQITPEYHEIFLMSTKAAFVIFSLLGFCGIFASLARGRVREEHPGAS
jgi:EmrB/QacA subfamily drug resistance transporter